MAECQSSATTLPWFLTPGWTRRARPAVGAAFDRGFLPLAAHVARVMDGTDAAEPGTCFAAPLDGLAATSPPPPATPLQVAVHIYGILVALHINTYATGARAAAHLAAAGEPPLTAAVVNEIDALLVVERRKREGGAAAAPAVPAGLPTMEPVWAKALRMCFVVPALRTARAPFVVPLPRPPRWQ